MNYLLRLAPILLGLAACQSTPTTVPAASTATPDSIRTASVGLEATTPASPALDSVKQEPANPEHAEWSTLTINGKLNHELTTKRLQSQLGRPDSIAKNGVECGSTLNTSGTSDQADFWYYGKTAYEVYGSRAILASCDVTTNQFRGKLGQLVLDKNTTLEDVRRFYPVSAKQADEPAAGRPGEEMMSIPFFFKGKETDDALILLFRKGRLQTVDFWTPC